MNIPQFIIHDEADTVGVIVVEGVTADMELQGWVMESGNRINVMSKAEIPLGHKIVLDDIKSGDTIIKYGHDIGKAVDDIAAGGHAHVQNVKTKKW